MLDASRPSRTRTFAPPLSATVAVSLLLFLDTLAILGAGYVCYDVIIVYSLDSGIYVFAIAFLWLVNLSLLNFGGMYQFEAAIRPRRTVVPIIASVAISFLFFLAAVFSLKFSSTISRMWVGTFATAIIVLLITCRFILALVLARLVNLRSFQCNLAIIGEGAQVDRFLAALREVTHRPVNVSQIYSASSRGGGGTLGEAQAGSIEALVEDARSGRIDDVAIAIPWSQDDRIMECVARLRELPVNVYLVNDLVGFRTQLRAAPTHFSALPISEVISKPMGGWDAVIKAAEDYFLGLLILLLLSPVLAIIAVAVKLDSRGPIIFKQKRLGFNNRVFNVYKFRTMFHNEGAENKTVQAVQGDARVTRIGRFLRRTSLDELPQIFNVLDGSMSIVGPRPHALDHNEEFSKRMQGYFARHRVKPGITGLAQVKGYRGPTDTEEKLEGRIRNDIHYAENWSLSLDLQILLRTIIVAISGRNAY